MKKTNSFQIAKVEPLAVVKILLDFFLISAWCCLKQKRVGYYAEFDSECKLSVDNKLYYLYSR